MEEGTISSSILDCGGPMEWSLCHWTADLSDDAEVRVEGRVSNDSSSMGPWIELQQGPVSGSLESGARYLQYRIHLIRGTSAVSPVVHDMQFSVLDAGLPAPRRPTRRLAP